MRSYDYALCFGLIWTVSPGCSVPDLQIVETRDDGTTGSPPFVPRELPDAAPHDGGTPDANVEAGNNGRTTGTTAGAAAGGAGAAGSAGTEGTAGAAAGGRAGSSGSDPVDAGTAMAADASPPPVIMPPGPGPTEPNPCLVWQRVSSFDRAPENAVEGGLETTAGLDSRQYVCRVRPPDLEYAVPGKAIFGNGCLVAYRADGATKVHNQQNGSPFEVLTSGPGCSFAWQQADNSTVPSGALDLSDPPGERVYGCRGDFDGPLSSGVQVGGVHGAKETPPRYECWFESYVSPMQPRNPMVFEVLVQAP